MGHLCKSLADHHLDHRGPCRAKLGFEGPSRSGPLSLGAKTVRSIWAALQLEWPQSIQLCVCTCDKNDAQATQQQLPVF